MRKQATINGVLNTLILLHLCFHKHDIDATLGRIEYHKTMHRSNNR